MEVATEQEIRTLRGIIYGVLNTLNSQWYIGSTTRTFRKRYKTKSNWWKHSHNEHLRRSIDKHGIDKFKIFILESGISGQEELDKREQWYIRKYKALHPDGYNFDTGGKGGRLKSEASKLKKSKSYTLKHRDGRILKIVNAHRFCQENNINSGDFGRMINGKQIFAGDYCLPETDMRITRRSVGIIRVKDVDGKIEEVTNMTAFAKQVGLNPSAFIAMCRGHSLTCGGWSLESTIVLPQEPGNKTWNKLILVRDGEEFEVTCAREFAREHGFDGSCISSLVAGDTLSIKGFRLRSVFLKDGSVRTLDDKPHYASNRKYLDIVVRLKNGDIVKVDDQDEFCCFLDLDRSAFCDALKGKIKNPRKYEILNCRINPDFGSDATVLERHAI